MGSTVLCLVAAAALLCAPVFAQKVAMRLYPGCAARCRVRESTALTRAYVRPQERTLVDELAALSWERSMQVVNEGAYIETLHRFIQRAVDSGRGLDERDGDGRTALHWAAANGFQDQVAALLDAGADPNSACQYVRQTPLYMAARWGRSESVKELLQRGADPSRADKFGKNAFDAAMAAGDTSGQMHELMQQAAVS